MGKWFVIEKNIKKGEGRDEGWGVGGPRWGNDLKLKRYQKRWGENVSGEGLGVREGGMIWNEKNTSIKVRGKEKGEELGSKIRKWFEIEKQHQ